MPESNETSAHGAYLHVTLEELEKKLADLQARLPAHSIPPSMIAELDELEEALAQARQQRQAEQSTKKIPGTSAGIVNEGPGGRH
jgi:ribosomal protein L29